MTTDKARFPPIIIPREEFMNVYLCVVCGFIYDEAAGRPEDVAQLSAILDGFDGPTAIEALIGEVRSVADMQTWPPMSVGRLDDPDWWTEPALVTLDVAEELRQKGYHVVGPDPQGEQDLATWEREVRAVEQQRKRRWFEAP